MTASASRRWGQLAALLLVWLLLTLSLASAIVHTTNALEDYVTPHLGDTWLLLAAFVAAALLGALTSSIRLLIGLTLTMCLGAAALYGAVLYLPAWSGIVASTVALQNYASQQALVVLIWLLLPATLGAGAGQITGARLRARPTVQDERAPWWEREGTGNRE